MYEYDKRIAKPREKKRRAQPIKLEPAGKERRQAKKVRVLRSNEQITREYEENMRQIVANLVNLHGNLEMCHQVEMALTASMLCLLQQQLSLEEFCSLNLGGSWLDGGGPR